jgi:hypothetical protein
MQQGAFLSSYAKSQANRTAMSFEFFHTRKLHHRRTHVLQAFFGKMGASDVLYVRSQVDTRVLLCVSVGSCPNVSIVYEVGEARRTYAKSG